MATEEQIDRLIQDPGDLLEVLGQVAVSYSQLAFKLQRFGSEIWPVRYPGSPAPILNVAGALADFNRGATAPLDRRFINKPALKDTGLLEKSIETQTISATGGEPFVEIGVGGAAAEYAPLHNFGLESRQPVTDGAKSNIAAYINTDAGAPYRDKLSALLEKTELVTQLETRQFIGVNQELERLLADTVEEEAERI